MTETQKLIKVVAMVFAVFLIVCIFGGILSALGLLGGLSFRESPVGDAKDYALSSKISSLDLEISAADLTIREGDGFSLESNLKRLTVDEKNGVLRIRENKIFSFGSYHDASLILTVPEGTVFDSVHMETGAGRLTVEALRAEELSLELGAGDAEFSYLEASREADIEGGAGRITVKDGKLRDPDLQIGVGEFTMTAALLGNGKLELGVGETNLHLLGSRDDYRLDIDKGIGSVTVDGKQVSDGDRIGDGGNKVKIDCGVGRVEVVFGK